MAAVTSLDGLAARTYDVIVIGGGINGAGVARAAARAGLSVLLLEKEDFGWGTTWRSTKLIHGGLRYLEHAEFELVFESLRDQASLLNDYPRMVRPLSFLLPVYQGDRHRPLTVGLGLTLYDALSIRRSLPLHVRYDARTALALEPGLRRAGLLAAFTYSDCQVRYPERLCLQTILEAREAGADTINHAEMTGFLQSAGTIVGVTARDLLTRTEVELRAAAVVNAAGPWVDNVIEQLGKRHPPQLSGTKGAHIVVDYRGAGPLHAVYAEALSDHRPFFVVPWRNRHLIGTTDTRFHGSPDDVAATGADVTYLLNEANALLPATPLEPGQVDYAYAGVRPLPASAGVREGAISRRHVIRDHAHEGHPGLLSIIGGKLSTYRSLATQTLDKLQELRMLRPSGAGRRSATATARALQHCDTALSSVMSVMRRLNPPQLDDLRAVYGPRLASLLQLVADQPALLSPLCPHGPAIQAQVVLAARDEQARTLADALLRRTDAGLNRCLGLDCAPRAAALMARELGWPADRVGAELARYAAEIRRTFIVPQARSEANVTFETAGT